MLSLVNYGSSDESEDENSAQSPSEGRNEPEDSSDQVTSLPIIEQSIDPLNDVNNIHEKTEKNLVEDTAAYEKPSNPNSLLFGALPPPVSSIKDVSWEQLSKLSYKSQAIRILAPALPKDDQKEEKKEKKFPSKSGSGLLAMLPKPKHGLAQQKRLTPCAVMKPKRLAPPPVKKVKVTPVKPASESEEEDDATGGDFFALSSAKDEQIEVDPSLMLAPLPDAPQLPHNSEPECFEDSSDYMSFTPNEELELDENAVKQLCGSRGLKRRPEELQMIDIDGSQLIPDAKEILTKNLTTDLPRRSAKSKGYGPTSQQKRKHQIIYLAHQAKEMELELQTAWANNRMTRKQTQAKYGF